MAKIIEIARHPDEYYLECDKCGNTLWGIVCTNNTIIKLSCAECSTVFDFTEEGVEFEMD